MTANPDPMAAEDSAKDRHPLAAAGGAVSWKILFAPPCLVAEVLLAMFLAVFVLAQPLPSDAALFPSVVGGLGVALCVGFLGLCTLKPGYAAQNLAEMEEVGDDKGHFWIAFIATPVYSVLIYVIGFHVSTFLAMIVVPYLLGYRGWGRMIAIALGVVVIFHLVFVTAVEIDLPIGLAGDAFLHAFVYQD